MAKIEIIIHGTQMEVVCGELSIEAYNKLSVYCNDKGYELGEVWYDSYLMTYIMGDEGWSEWWEYYDYLQEYGMIFDEKAIIEVYVDGKNVPIDRQMIFSNVEMERKPKAREGYVIISSGSVDKGSIVYSITIDDMFDVSLLMLDLWDYNALGYDSIVISGINYGKDEMKMDEGGSTGKYMLDVHLHE